QSGIVLHSEDDLQDVADTADHRPDYPESLDSLTIDTLDEPPIVLLRDVLSSAMNITDLVLLLPFDAPQDLLAGLRFRRLALFKTNMRHGLLISFFAAHPSVKIASLGSCGRGALKNCPLGGCNLSHVLVVECPCSCVDQLSHRKLSRLTIESQGDTNFNAPAALKSLSNPLPCLSSLVIDFHPNDYDILDTIIRVAPNLSTLKLLEKSQGQRGCQSRRAWNDRGRWFSSLLQLGDLEELALRTSSCLLPSPLILDEERAALITWVTRFNRSQHAPISHPTISCLRIWYQSGAGSDIITVWSKSSGTWCNISRTQNPPVNAMF
ncbi:hypothetical protein LXA43DRAFT_905051, partial [Ganoderma leucocontextum]